MKIAIVNLKNKKVEFSYEAEDINIKSFGGPWGDPSQCEHIKIPQELESEPIENLESYDGEEQISTETVLDGEEQAYDSNNRPVRNPLGLPVMVPKYKEVPVIKQTRLMRIKQ